MEAKALSLSLSLYKCASVDTTNHTWTGYKAVLNNQGYYEFEENATSGLIFTEIVPTQNFIYSSNALAKIENLYTGFPVDGLVFYLPLNNEYNTGGTGQTVNINSNGNGISYQKYKNIDCIRLYDGSNLYVNSGLNNLPTGNTPFTASMWGCLLDRGTTYRKCNVLLCI